MRRVKVFFAGIVIVVIISGCNMRVNKSVYIEDGRKVGSSQMSVNGNITIGSDCEVRGSCKTVNGNIQVGKESRVKGLQSVNGVIVLDEDVKVSGSVESVNGSVECAAGVLVRGDIATINGHIDLTQSKVRDDLTTYNGDITLTDHSEVGGDILVKEGKGNHNRIRHIQIEIADGSVVKGDVRVLGRHLNVTVYLSSGGKVEGEVIGAEVVEE